MKMIFTGKMKCFILFFYMYSFVAISAVFSPTTVAQLITNITTANGNSQPDVIDLGGLTFSLSAVNNTTDGQNGLPVITESFNLTIQNGTITRSANALRILAVATTGNLSLINVVFSNGLAQEAGAGVGKGGAIFNRGTIALIDACTFSANVADGTNALLAPAEGSGGAIFLAQGSITMLRNSVFNANQAIGGAALATLLAGAGPARGGAIFLSTGTTIAQITNTTFSNNIALGGAAAAGALLGGRGNTAFGSAIYSIGTINSITESTFSNNSSTGGAAISNGQSFVGGDAGGAIYVSAGTLGIISGTLFSSNIAAGGAPAANANSMGVQVLAELFILPRVHFRP